MDSHPTCRHPHKKPAHTFKELRMLASAPNPFRSDFRRSEPPIIAGFSASSTPFFEGRLTEVDVVADAASSCDPEVFSSKRAAYYGELFAAVNTQLAVDFNFLRR